MPKRAAGSPAHQGGKAMTGTHLRVYRSEEEISSEFDSYLPEPHVRVRLGDLLPLVAMAQRMNFIWLKDFLDDEVSITEDLHQVLQTFRGCRPSA